MKEAQYFTPVVTALKKDGSIDKDANVRIWDSLIEKGMSGIVLMGSTGEFFALSDTQKKELINLASENIKSKIKFFVGTGNMRKEDTIELSNFAFSKGTDGVMIVGPYYFGLTDESIELYFSEVAKEVKGEIFLYNFPDRTSYDLKPNITLNLIKKHSNIVGYKDTVGNWAHTRELITTVRDSGNDNFTIMTGNDTNFMFTLLTGGDGAIGATSNVYPEICGAWIKAMNDNNLEKAFEIQSLMDRIKFGVNAFFVPVIKRAMMLRGIEMNDYCTFPFVSCTDEQIKQLETFIAKFDLNLIKLLS